MTKTDNRQYKNKQQIIQKQVQEVSYVVDITHSYSQILRICTGNHQKFMACTLEQLQDLCHIYYYV